MFLTGWPTRRIDETEVRSWEPKLKEWPSTGNDCSKHPGLDLDIRHQEAAEACEQKVRERFDGQGELLVRFGLAPKRLIPFRTDTPFDNGSATARQTATRHRIEFLGAGQQAVFYGITGSKQYHWHADRDPLKVPPCEWVKITEVEADQLLVEIDELLVEQFGYTAYDPPARPDGPPVHCPLSPTWTALSPRSHYARRGRRRKYPRHRARLHQCPHRSRQLCRSRRRRGGGRSRHLRGRQPALHAVELRKGAASASRGWPTASSTSFPTMRTGCPPTCTRCARPPGPGCPRSPARIRPGAQALALPRAAAGHDREAQPRNTGGSPASGREPRSFVSYRSASYAPATIPGISSTN